MNAINIFDFDADASIQDWQVVDDVVMGGESSGTFSINEEGHGVFAGQVSLENNGGFSSVRYQFDRMPVGSYSTVRIKLRGDRKAYQFRVKPNVEDDHAYVASFITTGEWEEITIPLTEMYPSYRGQRLNQPNFNAGYLEEIRFLIGNKKEESFKLLIDKITLE